MILAISIAPLSVILLGLVIEYNEIDSVKLMKIKLIKSFNFSIFYL